MTREEALILWLPVIADGVKNLPKCKEALDIAIRALKNEQTDGDLISRDYVLSKFKEQCERCGKYKENNGVMCRCCALDDAIDYVEDAPSIINGVPSAEKTDGDLISRQAVIQALKDNVVEIGGEEYCGMGVCEEEIESIVNDIPSAEKTAEWIIKHKVTNSGSFWETKCSNCGEESDSIYNYCPNCGAKMEESQDE